MHSKLQAALQHLKALLKDLYASYHMYLGFIIGIVAGLVLGGVLINWFFELFEDLTQNELGWVDDAVGMPIQNMRAPWLTDVMLAITWVGDRNAYIIFGVAVFIFFYLRYRSLIFPIQTSLVLLVSGGLNRWLKDLIDRPRPEAEHLVEATTMSFPSGHAMSSIAFFGFLIYLVWRLVSTGWVRWLLSVLLALLILLIGISRVYLGVHYPSDILAGYAAGGACLAIFISIFTYVRYHYARRGKEPRVTADELA